MLVQEKVYNFVAEHSRQQKLFNYVNECILKGYELFSFDVFDTLITRTTANPKGIFAIIQNELISNPK